MFKTDMENGPHPSDLDDYDMNEYEVTALHCYLCCPDAFCEHTSWTEPVQTVVDTKIGGGADPTEIYMLACGHAII